MDEDTQRKAQLNVQMNPRKTVYEGNLATNTTNPITGKPYITSFRGFPNYSSFIVGPDERESNYSSIFNRRVTVSTTEFVRYALSLRAMDRRDTKNLPFDADVNCISQLVKRYHQSGLGLTAITDMGGLDNALKELEDRLFVEMMKEKVMKEKEIVFCLINTEDPLRLDSNPVKLRWNESGKRVIPKFGYLTDNKEFYIPRKNTII
ncbi:hypothetical protein J4438_00945 [Candidatus Woesearchaeota archaeon]|nr:hypothetical protein [Candidatus Woesearchaeota archaeon]